MEERYKEIERSIIKKYRKELWSKFMHGVSLYNLIEEGDRVMVCVSGGKDSFLLAKCIEELQKHGNVHFDAYFVMMDPGYSEETLEAIWKNAEVLNVDLQSFKSDIFEVTNELAEKSPCYLCARMRRGHLYNKAKELGCNKIALGHHFDDVIETTLLSMFYGAELKTMLPKLHSDNFEHIDLIRPLYFVKEENIIKWREYNNLKFINCACKFTLENNVPNKGTSKRKEIKEIIKSLKKINKDIDYNIFKSLDNINLNCVLGYKKDGDYKSFLDNF